MIINKRNVTCLLTFLFFMNSFVHSAELSLVWSDEFSYEGLPDKTKWDYEEGYVRNGELQLYRRGQQENSRVEGGYLVVEAHMQEEEPATGIIDYLFSDKSKKTYSSASLTTKSIQDWTYGRIEVKAKLPQGTGLWPAIWLLGSNISDVGWPMSGEIDIMEYVGYKPNTIHSVVHTNKRNHRKNNSPSNALIVNNLSDEFHIYSVERTKNSIDFYIDNIKHFSYQKEEDSIEAWPFDKPMYLIINLAVGGGWGGKKGIDDSIFPQQFLIDYVRVYE